MKVSSSLIYTIFNEVSKQNLQEYQKVFKLKYEFIEEYDNDMKDYKLVKRLNNEDDELELAYYAEDYDYLDEDLENNHFTFIED